MVKEVWKKELKSVIDRCGMTSKETHHLIMRIAFDLEDEFNKSKKIQSYYNKSIEALIKYMKNSNTNPNENCWNKYALKNNYLSSKSIGYIYGDGFNTLCRKIRKDINRENILKSRIYQYISYFFYIN